MALTDRARDFWDRISPRERNLVVLLAVALPITLALWLGLAIHDGLVAMEKRNDDTRKALDIVETLHAEAARLVAPKSTTSCRDDADRADQPEHVPDERGDQERLPAEGHDAARPRHEEPLHHRVVGAERERSDARSAEEVPRGDRDREQAHRGDLDRHPQELQEQQGRPPRREPRGVDVRQGEGHRRSEWQRQRQQRPGGGSDKKGG